MTEKRQLPHEWADVKKALQGNLRSLLDRLNIRDKAVDGMVKPLNPMRADKKPGSFVIWMKDGSWKDFACGPDEQGDIFDLIAYLERLHDRMSVYWWALEFLGWGKGVVRTKAQADQDRERMERERAASQARDEGVKAAKAARLKTHWLTLPKFTGTLVETYLREARRIPLERLNHLPGALRFEASADHVDEVTGEVTTWPAMCAAVTRGKEVTGLHRTFLAPDGSGKAPVNGAKKMYGSCKGGAIRLTPGRSNLTPTAAAKRGVADPLMLGEGIETTLTTACARPDYRAWSTMSLSFMALLEWPPCASHIILLRDNDWSQPEALAAFARAEAYWQAQAAGRPVKVVASLVGSDFNDMVTA